MQDRSAGIFVYDTNLALRVRTGDLVELRGVTAPGRYSPIVNLGELKVIGKGELPNPRRVSIEELVSGRLDCQWVEVKGTIHRASEDWGHLLFELANGLSRLKVRVLQYVKGVENQFIDAKVRVRGVVGSVVNAKGQLTGFHLLVPELGTSGGGGPACVRPVFVARSLHSQSDGIFISTTFRPACPSAKALSRCNGWARLFISRTNRAG